MPRVFIPQSPSKFDAASGEHKPLYQFDEARYYGELIICLPEEVNFNLLRPAALMLRRRMLDEGFGEDDFLVAVGSPLLIAVSAYIALDMNDGFLNMLTFDRRENGYVHTVVDLLEN